MDLIPEDQVVELWRISRFADMGFDGEQTAALVLWNVDTHDVQDLLYRDGRRNGCTHEQALRILRPVEAPEPELFSVSA